MRQYRIAVCFMIALSVLVGVGARTSAEAATKVLYWAWLDKPQQDLFYNLVKEFNDTHPDIEVTAEVIPWDSFFEKLS